MRILRFRLLSLLLLSCLALWSQRPASPPLVRSWTIREIGNYKKIPTVTLRERMAQRGVLFGVNEPYDQNKVDGTTLLLSQIYKAAGIPVVVNASTIPLGKNTVKVEYVVNKQ